MLFDEKELNIFDSNDARQYFQEILQSYYGKNYRATVVLLSSFTVYDLFSKLQTIQLSMMMKLIISIPSEIRLENF